MSKRIVSGDFPGGPAVKNPCFHCSVLIGELGSHMLSGEGGKGWGGGREGGREDEGKKEGRKEEIVWRDGNCVLEIRHILEFHLVPSPTLPLPDWVESGMFLKLSEASDSSSGEMMTKYSP